MKSVERLCCELASKSSIMSYKIFLISIFFFQNSHSVHLFYLNVQNFVYQLGEYGITATRFQRVAAKQQNWATWNRRSVSKSFTISKLSGLKAFLFDRVSLKNMVSGAVRPMDRGSQLVDGCSRYQLTCEALPPVDNLNK